MLPQKFARKKTGLYEPQNSFGQGLYYLIIIIIRIQYLETVSFLIRCSSSKAGYKNLAPTLLFIPTSLHINPILIMSSHSSSHTVIAISYPRKPSSPPTTPSATVPAGNLRAYPQCMDTSSSGPARRILIQGEAPLLELKCPVRQC